jgi:hypothetical protein
MQKWVSIRLSLMDKIRLVKIWKKLKTMGGSI